VLAGAAAFDATAGRKLGRRASRVAATAAERVLHKVPETRTDRVQAFVKFGDVGILYCANGVHHVLQTHRAYSDRKRISIAVPSRYGCAWETKVHRPGCSAM
jgi:hypothetical protein